TTRGSPPFRSTPRTRRPGSTSPTGSTTRTPPWRSSSTSPRQCCRPCTDGRGAGFCGKLLLVFRAETNNRFPQNPQLPAPDTQYGLICFHCPHCLEARQALRRSEEHRLNSSHVSISYAVFCL